MASNQLPAHVREAKNERAKILDEMTPELRKKLDKIMEHMASHSAKSLLFYHWLGRELVQVAADRATYGDQAIDRLAQTLDMAGSTLYKAKKFAELWSPEHAQELANQRTESGEPILWSHVVALLSVRSPDDRDRYEERIVVENLTASDLIEIIRYDHGGKQREGSGRTATVPRSASAGLLQLRETSETWLRRQTTVFDGDRFSVFDSVRDIPPDKITKDLVEDLQAVLDTQQRMAEHCQNNCRRAQELLELTETRLRNSGDGAPADDDSEKKAKKATRKRTRGSSASTKKRASKKATAKKKTTTSKKKASGSATKRKRAQQTVARAKKKKRSRRPARA